MRIGMIFQNTVALIVSLSLAVPPSFAQSIVGDGSGTAPQVITTANGLPMVMIQGPNAAGVSHNTYAQFNVGQNGAILNNLGANTGLTQQAGLVQGNANLVNGTASLIINEVTASNPSQLFGYLEVAGSRADVVVANPYGITCNGCGFINTDRATLTTGAPVFAGGAFSGFSVNGGTIAIGAMGADARGVGTFDIISQRVNFAGSVHGERVRVLAGRNDVIYATGLATAKAADGTEPDLAIDSTVLGGMYANAITIQSTEQGVGVKAPATMAANAGDMQITADGKLVIGRATTTGQFTAQARDIEVETAARGQQGVSMSALRDLSLQADAVIVSQAAIALTAGRDLSLGAGSRVQSATSLALQAGGLIATGQGASVLAKGNLSVAADAVSAAAQSTFAAGVQNANGASQSASLRFDIANGAQFAQTRLMSSADILFDAKSITVDSDPLLPASHFVALGKMTLTGETLALGHASIHAESTLDVTAHSLTFGPNADVFSRGDAAFKAASLTVLGGTFLSAGQISLESQDLTVAAAGLYQSAEMLTVSGATANIAGDLIAKTIAMTTTGDTTISGDVFGQTDVAMDAQTLTLAGRIKSEGDITAKANTITQSGTLQASDLIDITATSGDIALSGTLLAESFSLKAAGDITSSALLLDNRALAMVQGVATLPAAGRFDVTARSFRNLAAGVVRLAAVATFDLAAEFSNAGDVIALSNLTVEADQSFGNNGRLLTAQALTVTTAQMNNLATGQIEANTLTLTAPVMVNAGAIAVTDAGSMTAATSLTNSGTIAVNNALGVSTQSLANAGTISTDAAQLTISATSFTNAGGTVKSGFGVDIATASALTFGASTDTGGSILSDDYIWLGGQNGAAMGALTNAGQLVAMGDLSLHVAELNNQGILASGSGNLILRSAGNLANSGLIYAGTTLAMGSGGAVVNTAGTIMAATDLVICGYDLNACLTNPATSKADSLRNMNGGRIETLGGNLTLAANTISNERDVVFVAGVPQTVVSDEIWNGRSGCYTTFGCANRWAEFYIDTTVTKTDSISINGPVSQIISSGNAFVHSQSVSNQYGLMSTRGDLTIDAASVSNMGAVATETVDYRRDHFSEDANNNGRYALNNYGTIASSSTLTLLGSAAGRIEAGGAITGTITGTLSNVAGSTTSLQATPATAPTLPNANANTAATSPSDTTPADPSSLSSANTAAPTGLSLPTGGTISVGTVNLANLSNDQLFKTNSNSQTNYLIETRHSFINLDAFMSSDYFLASLNFSPDITQRRLGDAMVETMAVRNQLQQLTGGTILQSGISERAQMRAMYQNGIDAASALNLTPGVALNPSQIAALTGSMIWLQEQVVSGQRVLVPTVYLASSAGNDGGGAVIRGNSLALNTGNVTNSGGISAKNGLTLLASGNLTNSGSISATNALTLLASGNVTNSGGISAKNGLTLLASGDISNRFGSISAGTDLTLLANGTFNNISGQIAGRDVSIGAGRVNIETTAQERDWKNGKSTIAGPTASITATNALSIEGVGGIGIIGAALSGGTGLALTSQGNIAISSLQLKETFTNSGSNFRSERESTRFQASSLTAGNLIIGGDNIALTGANLSANGTIGLTAKGQVALLADVQTDYSYDFSQSSGWFSSSTHRRESFDATSIGTNLNGRAIAITAGGDITTQAAQITASTGQIDIASTGGSVILAAAVDIHASYSHSSSSFLGGLFTHSSTTERLNTSITANDLTAKTDIGVIAAKDLTSVGGTLTAGRDVALSADGTVTLAGAVSTDYASTVSKDNSGFFIVDTTDVSLTQSAAFTKINAGGDTSVTGAEVVAKLDDDSAAFGLNAKSLIGIDSAEQRLAVWGQGPERASGGGSGGTNAAHDIAGSTVNIGLPTALDDAGYAYLDELKASGQLTAEEMALVQHQFYDQQVQLGTLGKLLLQYLTASLTAGIGGFGNLAGWQQAMVSSSLSGSIEGALTGNFDLGKILGNAVFAGVSSGLTASFNLNNTLQLSNASLMGVADGQFSLASVANSLGDSVISAGLTTAVYGGEFGDALRGSITSSFVNLAQADLQTLIGHRYNGANALVNGGEGSAGHVIEHAIVGCVTGAALGGTCGAGAAAGAISAVYAGAVDPKKALENQPRFTANVELLGGLGAALASGGDTNATMIASGVAGSAFQNNYLTHAEAEQRANAQRDLAQCRASGICSEEEMVGFEQTIAKWNAIDAERDQILTATCNAAPTSPACLGLVREAMEFAGILGGDTPVIGAENTAKYFNSSLLLKDLSKVNGDGTYDDLFVKLRSIKSEQASTITLLDGFSASRDQVNSDQIWQTGLDGILTFVGGGAYGNGGAKVGSDFSAKPASRADIDAALRPNGELLGEVWGRSKETIRTVSASDFLLLRDTLLKGAKPVENYGNSGVWFELPAGGRVGIRDSMNSGQTLDIRIPGYDDKLKVHLNGD